MAETMERIIGLIYAGDQAEWKALWGSMTERQKELMAAGFATLVAKYRVDLFGQPSV